MGTESPFDKGNKSNGTGAFSQVFPNVLARSSYPEIVGGDDGGPDRAPGGGFERKAPRRLNTFMFSDIQFNLPFRTDAFEIRGKVSRSDTLTDAG